MQFRKEQDEDEESDTERDLRYLAASPKSSPKMGPSAKTTSSTRLSPKPFKKAVSKFKEKIQESKIKAKVKVVESPKTPSVVKPKKLKPKKLQEQQEEEEEVDEQEEGHVSDGEESIEEETNTGKIIALRTTIDRLHYRLTNLLMLPITNYIMSVRQKAANVVSFRDALKTMAGWENKDPMMLEFISLMTKGTEQHHEMLFVLEKRLSAECSLLSVADGNPIDVVPTIIDPYRFFKKLTETLAKSTYHWSVSDSFNDSPWNLEAIKTLICEVVDIVVDFFVPLLMISNSGDENKAKSLNQSQQKLYPEMAYLMRFRSLVSKMKKTRSKQKEQPQNQLLLDEISQTNQQMIAALTQTNNQIEMMNGLSVQSFDQTQKMFQAFQTSLENMGLTLQQQQQQEKEREREKERSVVYQTSPKSAGSSSSPKIKYSTSPPTRPVENPKQPSTKPLVSAPVALVLNSLTRPQVHQEPKAAHEPKVLLEPKAVLEPKVLSEPKVLLEPKVVPFKKKVEVDPRSYLQSLHGACPPVGFKRIEKKNE